MRRLGGGGGVEQILIPVRMESQALGLTNSKNVYEMLLTSLFPSFVGKIVLFLFFFIFLNFFLFSFATRAGSTQQHERER